MLYSLQCLRILIGAARALPRHTVATLHARLALPVPESPAAAERMGDLSCTAARERFTHHRITRDAWAPQV